MLVHILTRVFQGTHDFVTCLTGPTRRVTHRWTAWQPDNGDEIPMCQLSYAGDAKSFFWSSFQTYGTHSTNDLISSAPPSFWLLYQLSLAQFWKPMSLYKVIILCSLRALKKATNVCLLVADVICMFHWSELAVSITECGKSGWHGWCQHGQSLSEEWRGPVWWHAVGVNALNRIRARRDWKELLAITGGVGASYM